MTTKTYTVLEMEVIASDGKTEVPMRFMRDQEGAVEITMSGKFKTVKLTNDDSCILGKFLTHGSMFGSEEDRKAFLGEA